MKADRASVSSSIREGCDSTQKELTKVVSIIKAVFVQEPLLEAHGAQSAFQPEARSRSCEGFPCERSPKLTSTAAKRRSSRGLEGCGWWLMLSSMLSSFRHAGSRYPDCGVCLCVCMHVSICSLRIQYQKRFTYGPYCRQLLYHELCKLDSQGCENFYCDSETLHPSPSRQQPDDL